MNNGENNNTNINTNANVNPANVTPTNDVNNQNIQTTPLGNTANTGQVSVNQNNTTIGNMAGTPPVVPPVVGGSTNSAVGQNNGVNTSGMASNIETLTPSNENNDPGSVVNEKLKQVEINYTPPSKFKMAMTIFMFLLIIAFVIFLPDITSFVNLYKANKNKIPEKIITSGKLECTLKSHTANLDMEYLRVFKFNDSKLYEANYNLTTKGDVTLDEKTLNDMADKCNHLASNTKDLAGVSISCNYTEGKLEEKQNYIFASIIYDDLDAAFTEAGGTYPEFRDGQEIDSIEKTMNAAGYSCSKSE